VSLPPNEAESREDGLARARQAAREGDFPAAYAVYESLLEATPHDPQVLREYGQARYAEYEDLEGAAQLFERALQAQPGSVPTMLWLADVSSLGYGRGYDGAAALYREVARLAPREVDAYVGLGLLARSPGEPVSPDEAIRAFRTGAEVDPRRVDARANLGMLLWERGQREEAREALTGALQLLSGPSQESRAATLRAALGAIERGEAPTDTVRSNDSPRLRWPE
jgi:tetratricopeptide (TPR) repeat protein